MPNDTFKDNTPVSGWGIIMRNEMFKMYYDEIVRIHSVIDSDMNDEIMRQQEKNKGEAETSEAETSEAETSEAETGEAETGEPNEVSVFATLKTYNVKGNKGNDSQNVYIKEKINIYKYGGRIEEYALIKNSAKDKVLRLDFASFKRMISGENENKKLV